MSDIGKIPFLYSQAIIKDDNYKENDMDKNVTYNYICSLVTAFQKSVSDTGQDSEQTYQIRRILMNEIHSIIYRKKFDE